MMILALVADCPDGTEQTRGGCIPPHTSDVLNSVLIVGALLVFLVWYLSLQVRWRRLRRRSEAEEQAARESSAWTRTSDGTSSHHRIPRATSLARRSDSGLGAPESGADNPCTAARTSAAVECARPAFAAVGESRSGSAGNASFAEVCSGAHC
jgi:hypothetical protein